jgi:hypothetical protein
VIYIYRDARDVVPSSMKKFKYSLAACCKAWNSAILEAISVKDKNVLMVKFEDLVNRDETLRERLTGFLGTDVTYDVHGLVAFGKEWVANSSFNDVNSVFDKKAAFRWHNSSSPQVAEIYEKCRGTLSALGYDPC